MKIYLKSNVLNEAINRIRALFDEFDNIAVAMSGGKDSTVVYQLALRVAKERNRLPLKVLFLDQEIEWQHTIDYVRDIMYKEHVDPYWMQIPFRISNATSHNECWLDCWGDGKEWMRDKDDISHKENIYGTQTFKELFNVVLSKHVEGSLAILGGVRAEESPGRTLSLTSTLKYKNITWGKVANRKLNHYIFYPIYDWSYTDVWKFIFDNKYTYNKVYDYMYQYGESVAKMRVSNLNHETALSSLFLVQRIEPETWNKMVKRLDGINSTSQLGKDNLSVTDLPYMFKDWKEYRKYLLYNLTTPDKKVIFERHFKRMDKYYDTIGVVSGYYRTCVNAIIINDYHSVKLQNFENNPNVISFRTFLKGKKVYKYTKYIDYYIENYGNIK